MPKFFPAYAVLEFEELDDADVFRNDVRTKPGLSCAVEEPERYDGPHQPTEASAAVARQPTGPESEALQLGADTPTTHQATLVNAVAAAERPDELMYPTTLKADITALGYVPEGAKKKKKTQKQAKPGLGHED